MNKRFKNLFRYFLILYNPPITKKIRNKKFNSYTYNEDEFVKKIVFQTFLIPFLVNFLLIGFVYSSISIGNKKINYMPTIIYILFLLIGTSLQNINNIFIKQNDSENFLPLPLEQKEILFYKLFFSLIPNLSLSIVYCLAVTFHFHTANSNLTNVIGLDIIICILSFICTPLMVHTIILFFVILCYKLNINIKKYSKIFTILSFLVTFTGFVIFILFVNNININLYFLNDIFINLKNYIITSLVSVVLFLLELVYLNKNYYKLLDETYDKKHYKQTTFNTDNIRTLLRKRNFKILKNSEDIVKIYMSLFFTVMTLTVINILGFRQIITQHTIIGDLLYLSAIFINMNVLLFIFNLGRNIISFEGMDLLSIMSFPIDRNIFYKEKVFIASLVDFFVYGLMYFILSLILNINIILIFIFIVLLLPCSYIYNKYGVYKNFNMLILSTKNINTTLLELRTKSYLFIYTIISLLTSIIPLYIAYTSIITNIEIVILSVFIIIILTSLIFCHIKTQKLWDHINDTKLFEHYY